MSNAYCNTLYRLARARAQETTALAAVAMGAGETPTCGTKLVDPTRILRASFMWEDAPLLTFNTPFLLVVGTRQ
jgi:hypothetical protein